MKSDLTPKNDVICQLSRSFFWLSCHHAKLQEFVCPVGTLCLYCCAKKDDRWLCLGSSPRWGIPKATLPCCFAIGSSARLQVDFFLLQRLPRSSLPVPLPATLPVALACSIRHVRRAKGKETNPLPDTQPSSGIRKDAVIVPPSITGSTPFPSQESDIDLTGYETADGQTGLGTSDSVGWGLLGTTYRPKAVKVELKKKEAPVPHAKGTEADDALASAIEGLSLQDNHSMLTLPWMSRRKKRRLSLYLRALLLCLRRRKWLKMQLCLTHRLYPWNKGCSRCNLTSISQHQALRQNA